MSIILLFIALTVLPAVAVAYTAQRLPRGITWLKVAVAGVLLAVFLTSLLQSQSASEADGKGYARLRRRSEGPARPCTTNNPS
jgi:phosphotransferase system  glucose/maltose/N-acetylglucosamine-specific IIC component